MRPSDPQAGDAVRSLSLEGCAMRPSQYPSQDLANTLANIYPPYPPGFASSQTLRLSYGFANQQTLPPLPLPL
jgi:hypothetical protein